MHRSVADLLQLSVVLILCCLQLIDCHTNVGYQIHSNNDLREIDQLMLKGAVRFKFDPHFLPTSKCQTMGINSSIGCLILNHDVPRPDLTNYSTSDELIDVLKSSRFAEMRQNKSVVVALCFKAVPNMCQLSNVEFQNWLELVDRFHARAVKEVDGVEFLLDGGAKPKDCLIGRWLPWNSVWINTEDPQEAFTSNSIENDYYRFQVINDPENKSNWTWMAQNNYGKFSESPYPYQIWEPDHQEDILDYISIYQSGKQHAPGYEFAINVDSAMFKLYSANATGTAINMELTGNTSSPLLTALPPSLLYPRVNHTESDLDRDEPDQVVLMLCVHWDEHLRLHLVSLLRSRPTHLVGEKMLETAWTRYLDIDSDMSDFVSLHVVSLALSKTDSQHHYLMISGASGLVSFHRLTVSAQDDSSIVVAKGQKLRLPQVQGTVLDLSVLSAGDDSLLSLSVPLAVLSLDDQGVVHLATVRAELSSGSGSPGGMTVGLTAWCSTDIADTAGHTVSSARVAQLTCSNTSSSHGNKETSYNCSVLAFMAIDNVIVASNLTLMSTVCSTDMTLASSLKWVAISVGKSVDVSESHDLLMLVNDMGYCYNSHDHNTRALPLVCQSPPLSSEHVLDYSLGLKSDWLAALASSACSVPASEQWSPVHGFEISSCHARLLHGSYDQGSNPHVALVSSVSGRRDLFVEVHEGVPPSARVTNGCGDPLRRDGLVLDSFPIHSWANNLRIH